jgi:molecular chaperone HscB
VDIYNRNFFELFSLVESFQVDTDLLNQEYKKFLAQYHPDKVVNSTDAERLQALQISSLLNDAYATLASPLKRCAYLLTLHGVDPEENIQSHLGAEFLFKQIELREQLEAIGSNENLNELEKFKKEIETETQTFLNQFERLTVQTAYSEAKPVYSKLQFFFKLLSEIESVEEALLDY